ncbi:MAG: Uma2 family endonuclease [Nitrososphaerota archaeon]
MAPKAQIKFTYEDYKSLPYVERQRFELLEGELIPMTPSPGEIHQAISGELEFQLRRFVKEHHLGRVYDAPFDVVLGEENVVQPDILFVSNERHQIVREDGIHGAPDLVVEVLSPSTVEKDQVFKRTLYAKYGVREYWIVDPDAQTIEVLTLGERGYERAGLYTKTDVLESPLLVGLRIPLSEVF